MDVPETSELSNKAGLAKVESQSDVQKRRSSAKEEEGVGEATLQLSSPSEEREFVDVYCPLPVDLRTALAKLAPAEEASGAPLAAWLSGDAPTSSFQNL